MPVRIPEIPALGHQPINAPAPSAAAAAAPARALQSVARGIQDIGQPFAQLAGDLQRQENARQESEFRQRTTLDFNALLTDLEKNPDPVARTQAVAGFLQDRRHQLDGLEAAPAVRDRLTRYFDSFATSATIEARRDAAQLQTTRTRLALENEYEAALANGDRAGAEAVIGTMRAEGITLPEQADQLERETARQFAFRDALREIDAEPLMAPDLFQGDEWRDAFPDLTEEDATRLRRHATQRGNQAKADFWNDVQNEALSGTVLSADDLEELAETGVISARQRAAYLRAYHTSAPPQFDPAIYNAAHEAIQGYSPANDPTGAGIATIRSQLATLPLPKDHVRELAKRLDDRLKTTDDPDHKLAPQFSDAIKKAWNAGEFGGWTDFDDHDNNQWTEPKESFNLSDYNDAANLRRKFNEAWDAYLGAAPPDVTYEEAKTTFDSLFDRIVRDKQSLPTRDLFPTIPPPVDFGGDIDSLLGIPAAPAPETGRETSATFGGQPIRPPGVMYRGAVGTVFGGANDPADSGVTATGESSAGRAGVAIPKAILDQNFPGKDKKWLAENVRAVVTTPAGSRYVFPWIDYGTAEWVWEKNGRPTLDLTQEAAQEMGAQVILDRSGQIAGVEGLERLDFAIVSTATSQPATGRPWQTFWNDWFQENRPKHAEQADTALEALLDRHAFDNLIDGTFLPPKS